MQADCSLACIALPAVLEAWGAAAVRQQCGSVRQRRGRRRSTELKLALWIGCTNPPWWPISWCWRRSFSEQGGLGLASLGRRRQSRHRSPRGGRTGGGRGPRPPAVTPLPQLASPWHVEAGEALKPPQSALPSGAKVPSMHDRVEPRTPSSPSPSCPAGHSNLSSHLCALPSTHPQAQQAS